MIIIQIFKWESLNHLRVLFMRVFYFLFYLFFIFIKFTIMNNYNTKAKGAWKYITTLKLTLNIETQILQKCHKKLSCKSN